MPAGVHAWRTASSVSMSKKPKGWPVAWTAAATFRLKPHRSASGVPAKAPGHFTTIAMRASMAPLISDMLSVQSNAWSISCQGHSENCIRSQGARWRWRCRMRTSPKKGDKFRHEVSFDKRARLGVKCAHATDGMGAETRRNDLHS